jgi:RNA polymerase sigma factor (sigma-70 family)
MNQLRAGVILEHARKWTAVRKSEVTPDRELLRRFAQEHDEAAFAVLVRRHGPMVLHVCRRHLGNWHDAEDVCQAVFVVLAAKAAARHWQESVANWLHQVAYNLARKARAAAARRCAREGRADVRPPGGPEDEVTARELRAALDEELARLPEKYRAPLVLCYLEGATRDEAAQQLGWPLGTLKSRVERGRQLLHGRLVARGLTLSAALSTTLLTGGVARAALPPGLARGIVQAALLQAAGRLPAEGSATGAALGFARRLVRGLLLNRIRTAAVWLLGACLLAAGLGLTAREPAPGEQAEATLQSAGGGRPEPPGDPKEGSDRFGDPLPPGALARLGTLRFRHGGLTPAVQFAPDGKTLLTMGQDGLRTWDVRTGRPLHRLANQEDRDLSPGILRPDGKQVVTVDMGAHKGRLRLWDVATGRLLQTFGDHPCGAGCFAPDGSKLATFGTSQPGALFCRDFVNTVALWDLTTGRQIASWAGHQDGVHCGVFTADGKTLITGGGDRAIRFWDVATGTQVRAPCDGPAPVGHLVLSPDENLLAAIDLKKQPPGGVLFPAGLAWHADNGLGIWDLATGKQVRRLTVPWPERRQVSGFTAAVFTPDGKGLVTGGVDRLVRLWELDTGAIRRRYDLGAAAWALALSPDGKTLAGLPGARTVRVLDTATGRDVVPPTGHPYGVRWVLLTADNETAVTGAGDTTMLVWDLATAQERRRLEADDPILFAVLAADGRTLYSFGMGDRKLIVWDLVAGNRLRRLPLPPALDPYPGVGALSADGKTLALAAPLGQTVFLIDTAAGRETRRLEGLDTVAHVAFSRDGRTLAVVCRDATVHVWDPGRGTKLRQLPLPEAQLFRPAAGAVGLAGRDAAALSPDGRFLAYVRGDGSPALLELATGTTDPAREPVRNGIRAFAFSPDSRTLAWSGWRDPTIHLLEVATGGERHQLVGHHGPVECLTFSADGKLLVSGGGDTTALVWDLTGLRGAAAKGLTVPDLEACWADLARPDAARGFRAVQRLASAPAQAVPYLTQRLRPIPGVTEERLVRLIADLGSKEFDVREKATRELERVGELATAAYRKALDGRPGAETRRRVEALLDKQVGWWSPSGEQLQALRALEVLERIATAEARKLLQALAGGAPEARLTQEATAALQRLARRRD